MTGSALKYDRFPPRIRSLEPFSERFEAFRLAARGCDVLFASYPAGTRIEAHIHDTENWGVITRGEMMLTVAGRETRYAPGDWYHVHINNLRRRAKVVRRFGDRVVHRIFHGLVSRCSWPRRSPSDLGS